MPKLWLCQWPDGEMFFQDTEPKNEETRRVQVEINNSLYRQILAAETKYHKFQDAMEYWLDEAEAGRLKRISDGR